MPLKKVLIVDDNRDFAQLLYCALEDDFEVFTATNGAEGVMKAAEALPDLILMDVMMPGVSGIEMLRQLSAEPETRAIPVIVLTGSNLDKGMPDLFRQEGNIKQFLSKTTPVMDIVATVKKALYGT